MNQVVVDAVCENRFLEWRDERQWDRIGSKLCYHIKILCWSAKATGFPFFGDIFRDVITCEVAAVLRR